MQRAAQGAEVYCHREDVVPFMEERLTVGKANIGLFVERMIKARGARGIMETKDLPPEAAETMANFLMGAAK